MNSQLESLTSDVKAKERATGSPSQKAITDTRVHPQTRTLRHASLSQDLIDLFARRATIGRADTCMPRVDVHASGLTPAQATLPRKCVRVSSQKHGAGFVKDRLFEHSAHKEREPVTGGDVIGVKKALESIEEREVAKRTGVPEVARARDLKGAAEENGLRREEDERLRMQEEERPGKEEEERVWLEKVHSPAEKKADQLPEVDKNSIQKQQAFL